MLATVLRWTLVVLGVLMAGGTAASLSRGTHWAVRNWDFPRMQIAFVAGACGILYRIFFFRSLPAEWAYVGAMAAVVLWQTYKIYPYTRIGRVRVEASRLGVEAAREAGASFRLLISNVLMENEQHDLVLRRIAECDPDAVLLLEIDARWARAVAPLAERYPHVIAQPQENYYGMMLFSRLSLVEPQVRFLVQPDVPSIHTGILLKSGAVVYLHGLHPRPPEPLRNQPSAPRDAEFVVLGHEIASEDPPRPTVVAGDLNDVAWSPVSELFLRLSGLMDPRMGRGMFNSYNANNALMRFPLDHVFHSNHFRLLELKRLEAVGSDHFPILAELSYEPDASATQPETAEEPGDRTEAREKVEAEAHAAATGSDRPDDG
ncbi:MAG TPA: endonuclease/exonuclease/phosphatase family protein [Longimicrobiaceae bacterium]|jgi:endonuclease/exonuclease/phosphatase (EEP) superfamily protein YafD|nr:endonuclease/exonuclease/phosphatase family protein [Longimicrobiaceae bacterium]